MTTHGCLKIRLQGERRSVLLTTTHSGQDGAILDNIMQAPTHHAQRRFQWITAHEGLRKSLQRKSTERLEQWLIESAAHDGIDDPPSVAAWIIAAKPNYLMPVPPAFVRDLPEWSGADRPCELILGRDESPWIFRPELSGPVEIEPWPIIVEAVREMLAGGSL